MNKIYVGDLNEHLNEIIDLKKPKYVLIITGKNSFYNSKLQLILKQPNYNFDYSIYHKKESSILFYEILTFLKKIKNIRIDLIIAYGGGSVIDFSKIVSLFKNNLELFESDFNKSKFISNKISLLAVPTTSGSGAESTEFAVLYKNNVKFSVINKIIMPDYVILDPKTTYSLSKKQIAYSGIDALCQSIESLWAKNKSTCSEKYALKALKLIYSNLKGSYLGNKTNRKGMLLGANLSGKAINISKTTAPHALSYYLTSYHNIPHGEAVAISFESFMKINFKYIRKEIRLKLFEIFNVNSLNHLINKISELKKILNLKSNLAEIENLDFDDYLMNINEERLKNNPSKLDKKALKKILAR